MAGDTNNKTMKIVTRIIKTYPVNENTNLVQGYDAEGVKPDKHFIAIKKGELLFQQEYLANKTAATKAFNRKKKEFE